MAIVVMLGVVAAAVAATAAAVVAATVTAAPEEITNRKKSRYRIEMNENNLITAISLKTTLDDSNDFKSMHKKISIKFNRHRCKIGYNAIDKSTTTKNHLPELKKKLIS